MKKLKKNSLDNLQKLSRSEMRSVVAGVALSDGGTTTGLLCTSDAICKMYGWDYICSVTGTCRTHN